MVYSLMHTCFYQNTHAADYRAAVLWLFHHLIARSWDKGELKKSILAADAKLQIRNQAGDPVPTAELYTHDNVFLYLPYHPFDIPKRRIHQLYDLHCQEAFSTHLGINNLTIAYSWHQSLKEHLTRARLHQALGKEPITYYATHRIAHMETNLVSHGNPHNSIWFSKKSFLFFFLCSKLLVITTPRNWSPVSFLYVYSGAYKTKIGHLKNCP